MPPRLGDLGLRAKEHWKDFFPEMYWELERSGQLLQKLHKAENQILDELAELVRQGLNYDQGMELVQEKYLFLRPSR